MCSISKCQHEYVKTLDKLNPYSDFNIRVSENTSFLNPRPTRWVPWYHWDWHKRTDYYTILPNEVIFDLDAKIFMACQNCKQPIDVSKQLVYMPALLKCPHCDKYVRANPGRVRYHKNYILAEKIVKRLKENRVPFQLYSSGGKGLHFDIFLGCRENEKDLDWARMREVFAERMLDDINYLLDPENQKWAVDKRKWHFDARHTKGSLVRLPGGKKLGYKSIIHYIPKRPIFVNKPQFPSIKDFKLYYIPPIYYEKNKSDYNYGGNSSEHFERDVLDLCVIKMIDKIKSGEQLTHIQNLTVASRCLQAGYDREELHDIYSHIRGYDYTKTDRQINSVVNMLNKEPNRVVSCKTIRESGWCDSQMMDLCKQLTHERLKEKEGGS